MISIEQINGEIAALEAEKPTFQVMEKLASLYVVRDHIILGNHPAEPTASVTAVMPQIDSDSEFAHAICGKKTADVLAVMDELMTVLCAVNHRLYDGVMRKI